MTRHLFETEDAPKRKRLYDVPTGVIGEIWILSQKIQTCMSGHRLVTRSGEQCTVTDENSVYDYDDGIIYMTPSTRRAIELATTHLEHYGV